MKNLTSTAEQQKLQIKLSMLDMVLRTRTEVTPYDLDACIDAVNKAYAKLEDDATSPDTLLEDGGFAGGGTYVVSNDE